jgi:ATP-dependent DNA ligase
MEALLVESIPEGKSWQYEPKWDGFCRLAFRDHSRVEWQSKPGQAAIGLAGDLDNVTEISVTTPEHRFSFWL